MAHSRFPRTPILLSMAMATSLGASAQAANVDIIYAAENALYGAGYDVGKVDGWMDNALRSAIRQYQAGTEGAPTGNLDEATLDSLGISVLPGTEITDNEVSDRSAAIAALGLQTSARRTVTARRPEPEPAPEPEPVSEPEPATATAPTEDPQKSTEAQTAASGAPAKEPEVSTTAASQAPAPVSDDAPVNQAQTEPQGETTEASGSAPAEMSVTAAESADPTESEEASVAEPVTPTSSDDEATSGSTAEVPGDATDGRSAETSEEPVKVAAAESEATEVTEAAELVATSEATPQKSSGGFFSRVFDFLFGWMF